MDTDNDKFIFNVKTVQSGAFRILIESLKEILTDTNIIFDKTGIKLIATDNSQIVLIHMKLNAENFEYFYCEKKTTIGINMMNMFKLIKTMNNNDTLTLFIEKDNPNINTAGLLARFQGQEHHRRLQQLAIQELFIQNSDIVLFYLETMDTIEQQALSAAITRLLREARESDLSGSAKLRLERLLKRRQVLRSTRQNH